MYGEIIDELDAHDGALSMPTRAALAAKAFMRTATYDATIAGFLEYQLGLQDDTAQASKNTETLPGTDQINLAKVTDLRYGENPHQRAALYKTSGGGIAGARQLHGKEMSFNNYVDADAAWQLVNDSLLQQLDLSSINDSDRTALLDVLAG